MTTFNAANENPQNDFVTLMMAQQWASLAGDTPTASIIQHDIPTFLSYYEDSIHSTNTTQINNDHAAMNSLAALFYGYANNDAQQAEAKHPYLSALFAAVFSSETGYLNANHFSGIASNNNPQAFYTALENCLLAGLPQQFINFAEAKANVNAPASVWQAQDAVAWMALDQWGILSCDPALQSLSNALMDAIESGDQTGATLLASQAMIEASTDEALYAANNPGIAASMNALFNSELNMFKNPLALAGLAPNGQLTSLTLGMVHSGIDSLSSGYGLTSFDNLLAIWNNSHPSASPPGITNPTNPTQLPAAQEQSYNADIAAAESAYEKYLLDIAPGGSAANAQNDLNSAMNDAQLAASVAGLGTQEGFMASQLAVDLKGGNTAWIDWDFAAIAGDVGLSLSAPLNNRMANVDNNTPNALNYSVLNQELAASDYDHALLFLYALDQVATSEGNTALAASALALIHEVQTLQTDQGRLSPNPSDAATMLADIKSGLANLEQSLGSTGWQSDPFFKDAFTLSTLTALTKQFGTDFMNAVSTWPDPTSAAGAAMYWSILGEAQGVESQASLYLLNHPGDKQAMSMYLEASILVADDLNKKDFQTLASDTRNLEETEGPTNSLTFIGRGWSPVTTTPTTFSTTELEYDSNDNQHDTPAGYVTNDPNAVEGFYQSMLAWWRTPGSPNPNQVQTLLEPSGMLLSGWKHLEYVTSMDFLNKNNTADTLIFGQNSQGQAEAVFTYEDPSGSVHSTTFMGHGADGGWTSDDLVNIQNVANSDTQATRLVGKDTGDEPVNPLSLELVTQGALGSGAPISTNPGESTLLQQAENAIQRVHDDNGSPASIPDAHTAAALVLRAEQGTTDPSTLAVLQSAYNNLEWLANGGHGDLFAQVQNSLALELNALKNTTPGSAGVPNTIQ